MLKEPAVMRAKTRCTVRIWFANCLNQMQKEDAMNPDEAINERLVVDEAEESGYRAEEERAAHANLPFDRPGTGRCSHDGASAWATDRTRRPRQ